MSQASKLRKSLQSELRLASVRKSVKRNRSDDAQVSKKQKTVEAVPVEDMHLSNEEIVQMEQPDVGSHEALEKKLEVVEDEIDRLKRELSEKNALLFNLNRKRSEEAVKAQEKESMLSSALLEEKRKFNEVRAEYNLYKKSEQERMEVLKLDLERCKTELMIAQTKVVDLEQQLDQEKKATPARIVEQLQGTTIVESNVPQVIELQLSPRKINFADVPELEKPAIENNPAQKLLLTPDKRNVRESTATPLSSAKKSEYALALEEQIKEVEMRRKKERENKTPMDYFPFGKPGGGAPLSSSNVTFIRSACISPSLQKQTS